MPQHPANKSQRDNLLGIIDRMVPCLEASTSSTSLESRSHFPQIMSTPDYQNEISAHPKMIATKDAKTSSRVITSFDEEEVKKEQIRRWEQKALTHFKNSEWEGKSVSHDIRYIIKSNFV